MEKGILDSPKKIPKRRTKWRTTGEKIIFQELQQKGPLLFHLLSPCEASNYFPKKKMAEHAKIGVLALQGGYKEVVAMVNRQLGAEAVEIRTPKDLEEHNPCGIIFYNNNFYPKSIFNYWRDPSK